MTISKAINWLWPGFSKASLERVVVLLFKIVINHSRIYEKGHAKKNHIGSAVSETDKQTDILKLFKSEAFL